MLTVGTIGMAKELCVVVNAVECQLPTSYKTSEIFYIIDCSCSTGVLRDKKTDDGETKDGEQGQEKQTKKRRAPQPRPKLTVDMLQVRSLKSEPHS